MFGPRGRAKSQESGTPYACRNCLFGGGSPVHQDRVRAQLSSRVSYLTVLYCCPSPCSLSTFHGAVMEQHQSERRTGPFDSPAEPHRGVGKELSDRLIRRLATAG